MTRVKDETINVWDDILGVFGIIFKVFNLRNKSFIFFKEIQVFDRHSKLILKIIKLFIHYAWIHGKKSNK